MHLLIHNGALGDWVLTWPLLRALAAAGPTAAVASAGKARLAAAVIPGVTAVDGESPAWSALHGRDAGPATAVRTALAAARLIVSFVSDGRDAWARNVAALAPGVTRIFIDPRPPVDWPGHIADWHLHQLAAQGLTVAPLHPPPCPRSDGPIVVHPGCGGRAKRWPIERFEGLMARLRSRGQRVRPVLGEVERETWDPATLARWREDLGAEVTPTLDALLAALRSASLYIGNDSGPTHLAAQLGLPTLALFGPTSPARWGPRGPSVTILAPPAPAAMEWLEVETVLAAVGRILGPGPRAAI